MCDCDCEKRKQDKWAEVRTKALREAADHIETMVNRWEGMSDQASAVMDTRHAMAVRVRRMAEEEQ